MQSDGQVIGYHIQQLKIDTGFLKPGMRKQNQYLQHKRGLKECDQTLKQAKSVNCSACRRTIDR
jgi:hypothetical protein